MDIRKTGDMVINTTAETKKTDKTEVKKTQKRKI